MTERGRFAFEAWNCAHEGRTCRRHHLGGGKWTLREEEPKYAPDRSCDVEHLKVELTLDLPRQRLSATATLRLRAAYGPFSEITLDAVDLQLEAVRDGRGRDLVYTYLDRKLTVRFPKPIATAEELVIAYRVERPSHGLYFIGPMPGDPKVEWMLWSQGEDEEARHWIPCHDAPHERMTTEMIVTSDAKHTVISNGELLSVRGRGAKKTWHFRENTPYPSYLISLCVGVFTEVKDRWGDIPVEYFVEPGREEEARRSFGDTPRMMEFFSQRLDCPYPYEKYAQVAVRHFMFGGMENLSATTQTDNTLHDARAALDFSSADLVAHELAHQWFGDLLTCEHWAHAWLNEGFATYSEALWKEEDLGREEFEFQMLQNAEEYLLEPYRRAIVSRRFAHPFQLFDAHLYPKGAWVVHMLRRRLGEDLFWKTLRLYVKKHAVSSVETIDLVRAAEQASGKSLQGFFDQWLQHPGHPDLEGDMSWDLDRKCVQINLKQVQKRDNGTPLYSLTLTIEALMPAAPASAATASRGARLAAKNRAGKLVRQTFVFDRESQTFFLFLPEKPLWVVIDPEGAHLKTMKVSRPIEWLEATLFGEALQPSVFARVDAVRQAAVDAGHRATQLLARVLMKDSFWGVQLEAALALGRVRSEAALLALLDGLEVKSPKARRAVVSTLGSFHDERVVSALAGLVRKGDASYFVQMAANVAYGRAAGAEAVPELRRALKAAVKRRDWHDLVAQGAAIGLAQTREVDVVDDMLALASDTSRYWGTRLSTLHALASLGAARPSVTKKIAEILPRFLEDRDALVATRLPGAFVTLGDPSLIGALRRKAESSPDPHMREACLMAADELAASQPGGQEVERLRGELDKLKEESRTLKQRLDKISAPKVAGRARANGK